MGREGSKMEEGEWGGETGPNSWTRGGREYKKGGLKSDLAPQYNWGVQPGMTERPIAPKDSPAGRPALSVDKHQDLTRRTHHQDPCGRQRPFPRNVLVQVTVEGQTQHFPATIHSRPCPD